MAAHDETETGAGTVWSAELNRRRFLGGAVVGAGLVATQYRSHAWPPPPRYRSS